MLDEVGARLLGFDDFDAEFESPEYDFESLADRSVVAEAFGRTVQVCGYEDLVAMEEAANRDEDRIDLKRLREVRGK